MPLERSPNVLETEHRNPLQLLVVEKLLGHKPSDQEFITWVDSDYAREVSGIVDATEYDYIRVLCRTGNYEEAANMIMPLLKKRTEAA